MGQTRNHLLTCSCVGVLVMAVLAVCAETRETNGKILACYYVPSKRVPISKIPATLCTHIIYAFAKVAKDGIQPSSRSDVTRYTALTGLKQKNPNLKVLLSLQQGFHTVVDAGQGAMQTFTKNAIAFLRKYGFDGIDFDWEFPKPSQKNNYMKFLSIFRNAVNMEAEFHGLSPLKTLQISMALSNNRFIAAKSYDVASLNKYIDFATVMSYDFHVFNAKVDNVTGYNSPLYSPKGESKYACTSGMMDYYLDAGLDRSKALLGMPTFGRSYTLADPSKHGLHSPASGPGAGGPVIHARGVYITMEICMALKAGAVTVMDQQAGVPYLYHGNTWVAYDNQDSFTLKCKWALQSNLAGMGVWTLALDDISGTCPGGSFPMLNTLKSCLGV